MTDRYNALTVVLAKDVREDDAVELINAIKQLRGVADVRPKVADLNDHIARERARQEIAEKLWKVLEPAE